MKSIVPVLTAVALVIVGSKVEAASFRPHSLNDQVLTSQRIVYGKIIGFESDWKTTFDASGAIIDQVIGTIYQVEVFETLKGSSAATVATFYAPGGTVGEVRMATSLGDEFNHPESLVGKTVVLFFGAWSGDVSVAQTLGGTGGIKEVLASGRLAKENITVAQLRTMVQQSLNRKKS